MFKIEFDDDLLANEWRQINWKKAEAALLEKQKLLTLAAFKRNKEKIMGIQTELTEDINNKCLAVRQIYRTGSMPGIDEVVWHTPAELMRAAHSLDRNTYHCQPMKLIRYQTGKFGKERFGSIPTKLDRAMMVLQGYALLPVTEAWADRKSFGGRPGRSTLDAHSYVLEALKGKDAPEWVVSVDLECFYATIRHSWLMENAPMDKKVLAQFLNAGIVFDGELFPQTEHLGLTESGNISGFLANTMLDGLQQYIYEGLYGIGYNLRENPIDYRNGNMIRSMDDILVFARTEAIAKDIVGIIHSFTFDRGLRISFKKTRIFHISEGFNYMSRTYIKKNGVVFCYPSNKAVQKFESELHDFILKFDKRKSQRELIKALNQKLQGWANYHKYSDAGKPFTRIDLSVKASLLEALRKKHPKLSDKALINRYFYLEPDGYYVFAHPEEKSLKVYRMSQTIQLPAPKKNLSLNYYLDREEIEERTHDRDIRNINGDYKTVWARQGGKCAYCGRPILKDQKKELLTLSPAKAPSLKNSAYVHSTCKLSDAYVVKIMEDIEYLTEYDLTKAISDLKKNGETGANEENRIFERVQDPAWKYHALREYFLRSAKSSFTLTFKELEKIMGFELNPGLKSDTTGWYPNKHTASISRAWSTAGYHMKKIDLKKRTVSFESESSGTDRLIVPDKLLNFKIPVDAVVEMEQFFKYIIKKYNIT